MAASPAVRSPEALPDGRVTFRLLAPGANEVTVNGDWIGATHLPMVKGADGVWTTTVGPMAPELYGYWFSVDGVRALDPCNSETERDGSRFSSLVMVDGPASAAWRFSEVPHGTIEQVWYPSPTLKMSQRRMYVYLPPGYRDGRRTFPVLYLLHGGGGDEDAWTTMGRASVIMDNLIAAGKAEPMVVVMPNGNDEQTVSQGFGYGPIPSAQQLAAPPPRPATGPGVVPPTPYAGHYPESIVKDVIPFVERTYAVYADPGHRAIAGLSRGGRHTIATITHNPEAFDYVGVFSSGGSVSDPLLGGDGAALAKGGIKVFWTGAGDTDHARDRTVALHKLIASQGIPTSYQEIPGNHYWFLWRNFLADFAPRIFR